MSPLLVALAVLMPAPVSDASSKARLELESARKAYAQASAEFKSDPSTKTAFVDKTVALATTVMMSPEVDRKVKYKEALGLYRDALKLDPENKEALENSQMIEQIYTSMGKEVPK